MTVLEDLRLEIQNYAKDFLTLEITNVTFPGGVLNIGEEASYRVRIRNNGHMDVQQVRLHLVANDGPGPGFDPFGRVSLTTGGPYSSSAFPPGVDVNAHSSRTVGPYFFRADKGTTSIPGAQDLFSAHVSTFDVNWEHILKDHTGHADPPRGTYSGEIHFA